MILSRRKFLVGLIAAPIIVRTPGLLMPVKAIAAPTNMLRAKMIATPDLLVPNMLITGIDAYGRVITEEVPFGEPTQKRFKSVRFIEILPQ